MSATAHITQTKDKKNKKKKEKFHETVVHLPLAVFFFWLFSHIRKSKKNHSAVISFETILWMENKKKKIYFLMRNSHQIRNSKEMLFYKHGRSPEWMILFSRKKKLLEENSRLFDKEPFSWESWTIFSEWKELFPVIVHARKCDIYFYTYEQKRKNNMKFSNQIQPQQTCETKKEHFVLKFYFFTFFVWEK